MKRIEMEYVGMYLENNRGNGILTTASTLQILCHAACKNNKASCAPSPTGTDLKVKRMLDLQIIAIQ